MVSIIRSGELSSQTRKLTRGQTNTAIESPPENTEPSSIQAEPVRTERDTEPSAGPSTEDVKTVIEKARLSVLTQFKEEVDTAREFGRQRGIQEGRAEGLEDARQTYAKEISRLKAMTESLPKAFESRVRKLEDVLVDIAFEVVRNIPGTAALSADEVQARVRKATNQILAQEKTRIRVQSAE